MHVNTSYIHTESYITLWSVGEIRQAPRRYKLKAHPPPVTHYPQTARRLLTWCRAHVWSAVFNMHEIYEGCSVILQQYGYVLAGHKKLLLNCHLASAITHRFLLFRLTCTRNRALCALCDPGFVISLIISNFLRTAPDCFHQHHLLCRQAADIAFTSCSILF